jgi:archaellum component FlaC
MAESEILHKISNDIEFLKDQITNMQRDISEINADIHRLHPEYKAKVEKRLKEGVFETYSSFDELRREIEKV